MKFGVVYHTAFHGYDPDAIIAYAKHAEDCGFESFRRPGNIRLRAVRPGAPPPSSRPSRSDSSFASAVYIRRRGWGESARGAAWESKRDW